ncbi:MAG: hypothetical protein U9N86_10850 [Bacteroidota bacterium]|nr:hypothetical protein [Bacteroidota bacterium]
MDNANYYLDSDFQDKVKFYMVKAAIAVMAELNTTDFHAERVAFAGKVLNNTASLDAYALGVSVNSTIKSKIDAGTDYDSDLEFVVNSLFTAYSGGAN